MCPDACTAHAHRNPTAPWSQCPQESDEMSLSLAREEHVIEKETMKWKNFGLKFSNDLIYNTPICFGY